MNPTTLDPQVVNLAKAIRQTESGGNFEAQGKSGELGAYQFTPDTWNKTATKYGITTPLNQATPEQQNAVAYNQIKEWKDAGNNVAQIASMWNAGATEPDAYKGTFSNGKPSSGTNNYGVKYSVPDYVYSVANAYQTLKNGGQINVDPNNPSSAGGQNSDGIIPTANAADGEPGSSSPIQQGNTVNDGFFTSLAKDPLGTLLVKPALRVSQAIAGTIGAITGNEALQHNSQNDQTFDVPILGKYLLPGLKPFGEGGASQVAGEAFNAASYLVPAGRAEKAGASLFKGQVMRAVGSGALAGAQFGALSGAGNELQNPEHTLGSVLENTLLSGGAGFALGGLTGGTLGMVAKTTRGTANLTKNAYDVLVNKNPESIYNQVAENNSKVLNLTKGQINSESRFAKDTPLFIAKEAPDVSWKVSKDGTLDTTPVIDALETKYQAEAQAFNLALRDSGEYANLDAFQRGAESQARLNFKGTAQEGALAKIDAEILAYKKQYADTVINHNGETIVPIHILDDIKSDLWSKTKFYGTAGEALQSQTSFLMGNTAKDIIENTVKDSPIKAWNKRLGDFAAAMKILRQRNGIKVGAGVIGQTGARIVGSIAGHAVGGIPGQIAGMITADQLLKIASDPNIKSYVFRKLLQRMQLNGQQGIIDEVQKVMGTRALERGSRMRLPAASGTDIGLSKVQNEYGAIPLNGPTYKSNTFANNIQQNASLLGNTLQLPAPTPRMIVPNTQGTPNFKVTGASGDVGGMRQRLPQSNQMVLPSQDKLKTKKVSRK